MKTIKTTLGLLLAVTACAGTLAYATDSSGAAQLDTSLQPPEGAIPVDQTPPISSKPALNNNNPQGGPPSQPMTPTGGNAQRGMPAPSASAGAPAAPSGSTGAPIGTPSAPVGTPSAPNTAAGNPHTLPTAPQPAPAGTPVITK
jgi:hypothetical protein